MNFPKPFIPRQPGSLKNATVALITDCGGNEEAAEFIEKSRVREKCSKTQMNRYGLPDNARSEGFECYMPADIVAALERHCSLPSISAYLAMQTGHVLLPTSAPDDLPLSKDLAKVGEKIALMFQKVSLALTDGKVTKAEAGPIIECCMAAIAALTSVVAEMRIVEKVGV